MEGVGESSSNDSAKRSVRGTTSVVWDYFDVQQPKGKVICQLCKQQLCYNRNRPTFAMRKHVHIKLNKQLHSKDLYSRQSQVC